MKGMELSIRYFEQYGLSMLREHFAEELKYMACGLVGEGSECFGYDDEFSQDHDFGPGFCIWVPIQIYERIGEKLQKAYDELPKSFMGYERVPSSMAGKRVGVLPMETFYTRFTNCGLFPSDNMNWMRIPENNLAIVTNGKVFMDNYGEFSKAREHLLNFYPEDVLRKKIAARVAIMAQSGQYNYYRCIKRGENVAAYQACAEFVKTALSCVFLLNGRYAPFYKWTFRAANELTKLRSAVHGIERLTKIPDDMGTGPGKRDIMENICTDVAEELRVRNFSSSRDNFLQMHLGEIMSGISDVRIRSMHVMEDC